MEKIMIFNTLTGLGKYFILKKNVLILSIQTLADFVLNFRRAHEDQCSHSFCETGFY